MNEMISELLKKVDVKQINDLLGKLPKDAAGKLDLGIVKKIADKLGADPQKLLSMLPGILKKNEGEKLTTEKMLGSIDIKDIAKLIPAAGAIKVVQEASKFASKKIDDETAKIQVADPEVWKGTATKEIQAAADKAAEFANTWKDKTATAEDISLLKVYVELAQSALDRAQQRKETLLKTGADKYSDPVAEMNTAIVKASGARRKLNEKLEEAEKKSGK